MVDGLDCIAEVEDSLFVDPWNRYRQVAVSLTTPDCRVNVTTFNASDPTDTKDFLVVVWPEREP
jgi:hypothetical protein